MSKFKVTLAVLAMSALLGACESTVPLTEGARAPVESRTPTAAAGTRGATSPGGTTAGTTAGTAAGTAQSQVASVDTARSGSAGAGAAGAALLALPSQRVVYFDFDSFGIRDEFKPLIDSHARVLSANKSRRLVIEGHTDDRGSREYNLALGQKRAEAVLRSLTLLGAAEAQLEAVSFGEERPAAAGADEAAWAKNRRAELKDR